MARIQIELPEPTAQAAREAGLLTPQAIEKLFTDAIRRHEAANALPSLPDLVTTAGVEEMSLTEIDAEIKAFRIERRRASGMRNHP